ncbi:PASTA domain-containing protein [Bacteroidota bacterium]
MKFFKFLLTKLFLKNFLYSIILVVGLIIITLLVLKIYTRHGQALEVPNLTGKSIEEVMEITKSNKLKYQIVDSVFSSYVEKGAVVEQYPVAGLKVKKRRTIFLVINSYSTEIISMPKASGVSKREAMNILENAGLEVGNIEIEFHYAKDYVLQQKFNDSIIDPGTKLPKGSLIDLVLGSGQGDQSIKVPNLISLNIDSARALLHFFNLNIEGIMYDGQLKEILGYELYKVPITPEEDSIINSAMIWKQSPEENVVKTLGSPVDIWLTLDSTKVFKLEIDDSEIIEKDEL